MACESSRLEATQEVWSLGSDTEAAFVACLRFRVNDVPTAKVSYLPLGPSGLQTRRAVRYSDDGFTWGTATEFGPAFTGPGDWSWGSAYTVFDASRQWAELGVVCKNASGTVMKSGIVTFVAEPRT